MLSRTGDRLAAGGTERFDDLAGMRFLQLLTQAGDGAAELSQLILARPGLLLQLVGVFVAETFHFVP